MSSKYSRVSNANQSVHFSKALMGNIEHSRMKASCTHVTTFDAGRLIPILCKEILPSEDMSIDLDFVLRQTTVLTPTMGRMVCDFYAFFVPNRIVNQSWKAVEGENLSGSWVADSVSLVPVVRKPVANETTRIPVGSVADYYGFPTQAPISNSVLVQCHDLKFRGYVMIYNEWFRDQNYQPPIPMSTLNVYQGFFDTSGYISLSNETPGDISVSGSSQPVSDGSVGIGAVKNALYGSGDFVTSSTGTFPSASSAGHFKAYSKPLKVNKFHDYFTSVLPSPQKSQETIFAPVTGMISSSVPIVTSASTVSGSHPAVLFKTVNGSQPASGVAAFSASGTGTDSSLNTSGASGVSPLNGVYPSNLVLQPGAQVDGLALSVEDIRMASAIQQVYETMARGGTRYREIVRSFFGIEADNPYDDIPTLLGHLTRELDLYQTAQTSASASGSTAQGNLAAFGYTSSSGKLFSRHFLEHGYVHVFAVVRHRNIYPSYLARDNFRLNSLDYYLPPLANISEQPVYAREINPFAPEPNDPFGYQEAFAEYRYEIDQVSGYMRPGIDGSLSVWNYADNFDSGLQICDGDWLLSNSDSVLDRTLAVTSSSSPQLKLEVRFNIDKTLPMPTYSVPGMDII